ncbi:hypothetical protein CF319_g9019, partial [Tilletia indica]
MDQQHEKLLNDVLSSKKGRDFYEPFLTLNPPWACPPISFDDTEAPVDFDTVRSPLRTLNICKNFTNYLAQHLARHDIKNKQVSNARYAFDYAYRVRRGIAVDSQAIRYKKSHLGAWTLPTERDPDQPARDPTHSDRSSSSRRTSAPSAPSVSTSHTQQPLSSSAAAST